MMRLIKSATFVLLVVAVECGAAPAQATKSIVDGFICHDDYVLMSGNKLIKFVPIGSVKNLKECFALCNQTPGCIAVEFGQWTGWGSNFGCGLYSSVTEVVKYDPKQGSWMACVKRPTYHEPPSTYQELPHFPRPDQNRPAPQPGPTPGGRR